MGFGAPPGGGNYPIDEDYTYNIQNMTPEMEAKFLWLMDQAANIAQPSGAGPLQPQEVAGFTPQQQEAFAMAGKGIEAWKPFMDKAEGYADQYATGEFDPESYKKFLDPYQDYVTQGISEQYDKAINQANLGAAGKGAFGGSRQGIMNAELLGGKALGIGQSLSQGFGTSMGLARGDFENQMQRYAGAAGMTAGMGLQTQQAGQADVASLMGAGSVQQQRLQQQLDAKYKTDLTNRYDPQQRFSWMSDIFRGVPSGQMATTVGTSPMTNPLSQALGAGIFGAGVASGWQNV
jgi:hypothetical protein